MTSAAAQRAEAAVRRPQRCQSHLPSTVVERARDERGRRRERLGISLQATITRMRLTNAKLRRVARGRWDRGFCVGGAIEKIGARTSHRQRGDRSERRNPSLGTRRGGADGDEDRLCAQEEHPVVEPGHIVAGLVRRPCARFLSCFER